MAIRSTIHVITREGADKGKKFLITPLSALRAEEWAARAMDAITKGNVIMPDDVSGTGFSALAQAGLKILLLAPFDMVKPLRDELMTCVQYIPDPFNESIVRALHESDIEQGGTYADLREQAFELIGSFF